MLVPQQDYCELKNNSHKNEQCIQPPSRNTHATYIYANESAERINILDVSYKSYSILTFANMNKCCRIIISLNPDRSLD